MAALLIKKVAQDLALTLDDTDRAFAEWLAEKGYVGNSIRTYIHAARQFRDWWNSRRGRAGTRTKEKAALKKVTLADLIAYQSEQPCRAASTYRARLSGLAKFLTWAGIDGEALIQQLRQQHPPETRPPSAPTRLSDAEEKRLRDYLCATLTTATAQRLRDGACVALVLAAGLRRRELCGLEVKHVETQGSSLFIELIERSILVTDALTAKVIDRWHQHQLCNGQTYLFSPQGRNHTANQPSETMFNVIVNRVFADAGLGARSASIQRLRNTCIMRQIEAGVALGDLMARFGLSPHSVARLAKG